VAGCCVMLPVGRNSGQNAQKGLGKKVGRNNLWPNFDKSGRKGAEEKYLQSSLLCSNIKLSETKFNFNFLIDPSAEFLAALMFF
jgi:hypothetical protein